MIYYSIKSILQTFHFATDLPIRVLHNDRINWQLPHQLQTIDEIAGLPQHHNFPSKQVSRNEWNEVFWSYRNNSLTILIGPLFLDHKPVKEQIRKHCLKKSIKPKTINKIFSALENNTPIIKQKQFIHATLLLEAMLEYNHDKNENDESSTNNDLDIYQKLLADRLGSFGFESTYVLEKQLIEHIKNNYLEDALLTLDAILAINSTQSETSGRNYTYSLCSIITRAFIDLGIEPGTGATLLDIQMNKISAPHYNSIPRQCFADFSELIRRKNNALLHPSISRALFYIDNHLHDQITLEAIAAYASLNPAYLADLFRKETGKTVIYTVNEKKILASCHLLAHSSTTILDIAIIFNFCNQAYYTKWFKKIIGCTPSEHRFRARKIYSVDYLDMKKTKKI